MIKKSILVLLAVVMFGSLTISKAADLSIGKRFTVGLILESQPVALDAYKNDKINVVTNAVANAGGGSYSVSYPVSLMNTGIKLTYLLKDNLNIYLQNSMVSISGTDNATAVLATMSNEWKFDITDISIGVGIIKDGFLYANSQSIFSAGIGSYSVKLSQAITMGTNSDSKSYSGSTIAIELNWLDHFYLTKSKNITFDADLGYKSASISKLGDYTDANNNSIAFDFSGIKMGIGLSYMF